MPSSLGEVALEQAVVAQDLQRDLPARVGEADAVVGLERDQAALREPLDHAETEPVVTLRRSARSVVPTASPVRVSRA